MMESEDMQNLKFCGEMPWGRTSPYRYYKTEMNGKHDCFISVIFNAFISI